jgi:hypothetical protein
MELVEIGCGGMDWIDLAQDRDQWRALVNEVRNLQVPHSSGNFLSSSATSGLKKGCGRGVFLSALLIFV